MTDTTWWVIASDILLDMLKRAQQGEDAGMLYLELIANSATEQVEGND